MFRKLIYTGLLVVLSHLVRRYGVMVKHPQEVQFVYGKFCKIGFLWRIGYPSGAFNMVSLVCFVIKRMKPGITSSAVVLSFKICISISILLFLIFVSQVCLMMLWRTWVECAKGGRVELLYMLVFGLGCCTKLGCKGILEFLGTWNILARTVLFIVAARLDDDCKNWLLV